MTTTVKVHVNGAYVAIVKHIVDGQEPEQGVTVAHGEEKSFAVYHGRDNVFKVEEREAPKA